MRSSKWNEITTSVKTKIELPDGQLLLTEKQWKSRGYVPISEEAGDLLWSNQHCTRCVRYLFEEEVRQMTFEEKEQLKNEQRTARDKRKEKQLQMTKIPRYEAEINRLMENSVWMLKMAVEAALKKHKLKSAADTIILDTEITGLAYTDELLQVSVIDTAGNKLYNSLLKPMFHDEWGEAARVNHISREDVEKAPYLPQEAAKIADIVAGAETIIGYGISFDIEILERYGIPLNPDTRIIDVMEMFAPVYGEWDDKYGCYRWQKLTTCAAYFEYDWEKMRAHDSLADCYATLYCYKKLKELEEKTNE